MYESSRNARLFILYRLAYLSMLYFFFVFRFGNICKKPYFVEDLTTSPFNDYFLFRLLSFLFRILYINKSIFFVKRERNCILSRNVFVWADCLICRVLRESVLESLEVFVVT